MAEEAQEYGLYGHSISVVLDLEASEDLPAETQEFFALDPGPLMDYLSQKGRGYAHVQKCNRFVLPTGKEYGRGWILMNAQTVKEMITLWQKRNSNGAVSIATPYRWTIKFRPAGPENNNGVEIKKLEIASVHSVTGYNVDYWADFPADIKLPVDDHYVIVEFVDARFSFQQSSFCTTDQAGDVRSEEQHV